LERIYERKVIAKGIIGNSTEKEEGLKGLGTSLVVPFIPWALGN